MQALIASPPEAATRKCVNCSNPMLQQQEWCLECGAASAQRPGRRAGLRSSAGILALTILFVCGAVGASYAALAPTKKHVLRPRVVIAQVTMPPPPAPAAASPTAPGTTAPLANVAPPTTLGTTKVPKLPKVPVSATPSVPTTLPRSVAPGFKIPKHTTSPPRQSTTNDTSHPTGQILLDTNAASTYNPSALPDGAFGDPAKAVDGDATTAWTYALDPARNGRVGAGLLIDLKSPHKVLGVTLQTPSPGMAVEFYGSPSATPPAAITDPSWVKLAARPSVKDAETVRVKGKAHSFRFIAIWIPSAATGQSTGSIGVSEVTVLR